MTVEQKTNAVNTFETGMNTDIHPMRIDNKTLRYARNIDFITAGTGNQLILQKRDGNTPKISNIDDTTPVTITDGYIPVAVSEMNNVLYIVSYNPGQNMGEIGTYPSPDYSGDSNSMLDQYAPFNNYSYDDINYNSPFRTRLLNFFLDGFLDLRLQTTYDGSVNVIITDDVNPVRIFNSRFSVDETGKYVELISRRTDKSTNSYSDSSFNHSELIPRSSSIANLEFQGLIDGGNLTAGGYRYFFRYVDADGAVTDLIEESRLISLHIGNTPESAYGSDGGRNTNQAVKFNLTNLDSVYYGIKVYYTISSGEIDPVTEGFEINTPFRINDDNTCNIVHTGYETVSPLNKEELANTYSPISSCKTLTTTNDRLLLANTESLFSTEQVLDDTSANLVIEEDTFDVYNSNIPGLEVTGANAGDNYANPKFEHDKTGYWKGETYELGIVYVTDTGNSPVYPVQGMDRLEDPFDGVKTSYPGTLIGAGDNSFGLNGLNSRGVYRTASNGTLFSIEGNYMKFTGTKLKVDVTPLLADVTTIPAGYLQTNDVTGAGWKIVYNPDTREYYLWGTVTNTSDGKVADLDDIGFNPQGIPSPSRSVNFGYVRILTNGNVLDNGLLIGDNLGKSYGPPIDVKNLANGFFFVRRKRIKDKVMEGITIPAAAFPSASRHGAQTEFGYPGNWIGCGTTTKGNPVVLAPTPSLHFPFGADHISTNPGNDDEEEQFMDLLDASGQPIVVTETAVIDPSLAIYDGIAEVDKLVEIKLSDVDDTYNNILMTGVDVDAAYRETGIPIESFNEDRLSITIRIHYLNFSYGFINAGTRIQVKRRISSVDPVGGAGDFIVRAPIKDYEGIKGWALYSPDTDTSPAYYASQFKNASMSTSIQNANLEGSIQYLTNPDSVNESLPYATYISSAGILNNSTAVSNETKMDFISDGAISTGEKSFTGVIDRALYIWCRIQLGDALLTKNIMDKLVRGLSTVKEKWDNPFRENNFVAGISRSLQAYKHYTKPQDDGDDTLNGRRPGTAIKYGRYIGMKIPDADTTLGTAPLGTMNAADTPDPNPYEKVVDPANRNTNWEMSLKTMSGYFNDGGNAKYSAYTQVFNGTNGTHLDSTNWEARYNDDSDIEYIAISRRYSFNEFIAQGGALGPVIDLYGGDCYLGQSWKQIWFPLGISEAPQATDITAYTEARRNLGLLNYGYTIGIPAQSNNNMHLRVPEVADEAEYKAFGKERSFVPLRTVIESRGNKQFDTSRYNFGYSDQDISDNKLFKLSDTAPYYRSIYPNRVYASEPSNQGDFVNGFSQFKSLNFRDYNTELGPISRIITLKDKAFLVFASGIATLGVNERTQVSTDTGGVFVDNADVLAQKADVISSTYGSTHPHSVQTTDNFVYGVDVSKRKIWRTSGSVPEYISDNRIQTLLGEILDEIRVFTDVNPTDRWIDVFTTYDTHKKDVMFTFYGKDRTDPSAGIYKTLVFNESQILNTWICETDDHRKFAYATRYDRVAFSPVIGFEKDIYSYDLNTTFDKNNIFRGTQYDAQIKFSVADKPSFEKLYENIWIVGDNPLPDSINYFAAHSNKVPLIPNTQILSPYTNVNYRMVDEANPHLSVYITMRDGDKRMTLSRTNTIVPPGRSDSLRAGDYITIDDFGVLYYYTVIAVDGLDIYVDKEANQTKSNLPVYFGYRTPLRLSDSSVEDGYGKTICQADSDLNDFERRLRGKWAVIGMDFKGEDQIYINNVVSTYTRSYS